MESTDPTVLPPFLRELSEPEWVEFRTGLEAYRVQGGSKPLRDLMAGVVQQILAEMELDLAAKDDVEVKEEGVVAFISELFSPATRMDVFERFRQIRMSARDFELEAVLEYNRAYTALLP